MEYVNHHGKFSAEELIELEGWSVYDLTDLESLIDDEKCLEEFLEIVKKEED